MARSGRGRPIRPRTFHGAFVVVGQEVSYGVAVETDAALAWTGEVQGAGQIAQYGVALETDTALAFLHARLASYAVAVETDSARSFIHSKLAEYGIALDRESWPGYGDPYLGPGALPFTVSKLASYGAAIEADTALAFTGQVAGAQQVLYGAAIEADTALAFVSSKLARYGVAGEADTALAWIGQVAGAQQVFYGPAIETDAAFSFLHSKLARYGAAFETDAALSFISQLASAVVLPPFAIIGETERPDRWDATERPGRWMAVDRPGRWDATERPDFWHLTVRPSRLGETERPSFWAVTIFAREDRDVALTLVAYGPFTENEVPEALLIRVMKPLRAGGTAPMELFAQTPAYVASVSIKNPAAVIVTRTADILDPAQLTTLYPDDFSAAEEGWVRVIFQPTDFNDGAGAYEIQVTLDNGTVVLKSTDVWQANVNVGPASAIT